MRKLYQFDSILGSFIIILALIFLSSVARAQCNADFVSDTCCPMCPTHFLDLSTSPSDPIVQWAWDFGDGSTSTSQNPVHTYTSSGTYNVSLVITTASACSDSVVNAVLVYDEPVADFDATADCNYEVTFTDQSIANAPAIVSWFWEFGDGYTSTLQNPIHVYATSGTYNVCLLVTNSNGCIDSTCKSVTILAAPVADFTFTSDCSYTTTFTDMSVVDPGDTLVAWFWEFGDGFTSTIQNPVHTYPGPGTYSVTLIVQCICGAMDTVTKGNTLYPPPVADFTFSPPEPSPGEMVSFFGSSSIGSIVSWFWDFDDGSSSTLQNPIHVFWQAGLYDVSLTVTDTAGCTATSTSQVPVYNTTSFPDDSTIWNTLGDNSISGNEWRFRYGMIGDTAINMTDLDTTYTYSKVYSLYDSTLSTQYSSYFAAIRTTEEGQAYALLPGFEETLLYDFTLEVGDTAWYGVGGALCYDGVEFWEQEHFRVVTSIDTIEIENGESRRRWQLEGGIVEDTWVEDIGSTVWYGLFNPLITDIALCGDSYSFACMKEGDEVVYLNNPKCDQCFCDLLTMISDKDTKDKYHVNVYPNPVGEKAVITFSLEVPAEVRLDLSDATGNIVKQIPYASYAAGKHGIYLESKELRPGMYLLRVTFNGKDAYTVKLLKGG